MNWLNTVDSWAKTPPVETVAPEGRETFFSALLTSAWTAFVLLPVMVPVIVASRSPLTRLTDCGPLTCWIVARVESGTTPAAVGTGMRASDSAESAVPGGSWTRTMTGP